MAPLQPDLGPCGLPPLPEISSEEIETRVFTHRSVAARPTHGFEDTPKNPSPDNELLEHVGDQVLGLLVTDLLQCEYPDMRAGPLTEMRALVVCNATLATIAVQYNLPDRLRVQFTNLKECGRLQANVFESYVGGLYKDQGLRAVKAWLDQLFTPYVHEAYRMVREKLDSQPVGPNNGPGAARAAHTPPRSPPKSPEVPAKSATLNPLSQFNACLQPYKKRIEWIFDETIIENNVTIWAVKLVVDGDRWGNGRGSSKQAARNEAAKEGLKRWATVGKNIT